MRGNSKLIKPNEKNKKSCSLGSRMIRTAILVDPMGSDFGGTTPEMEIAIHVDYIDELVRPAKLSWYRIHFFDESVIKPGTELVLFDFGGMTMGNSLAQDNSRSLLKWAKDNPSCLVLIMSSFTYTCLIRNEMEDLGLTDLPNVVESHPILLGDKPFPSWFL